MKVQGNVIKYGDNVDTDVIIPARYLNTSDPKELAAHFMEDLDPGFAGRVKAGDIMAAGTNFGCGSSREHAPIAIKASGISCVIAKTFARISTAMPSISGFPSSSVRKRPRISATVTRLRSTSIPEPSPTGQRDEPIKLCRFLNSCRRSSRPRGLSGTSETRADMTVCIGRYCQKISTANICCRIYWHMLNGSGAQAAAGIALC